MDGQFLVYFDITSRQSLSTLYEERKFGVDDLRLVFGGFVQAMEDAAEYLMNSGQMVIAPEYIFVDMEKKIYFCLMPGYEKDIREQFQALTEYILPKIDHEDGDAVILGYGVYRRGMEDSFHLEHIKEELYKTQGKGRENTGTTEAERGKISGSMTGNRKENIAGNIAGNIARGLTGDKAEEEEKNQNSSVQGRHILNTSQKLLIKRLVILLVIFLLLSGIIAAAFAGYLPYAESGILLGVVLVGMGSAMLISLFLNRRKKKMSAQSFQEEKTRWNQREQDASDSHTAGRQIKDWEINHNSESYESQKLFFKDSEEKICKEDQEKMRTQKKFAEENMKKQYQGKHENFGETVVLSAGVVSGPASLVSKEAGELATIYLNDDLTVIGKLENACDAVIELPTVSRIHAKIRKKEDGYYLTDMNSRNGTAVNGKLLLPDEEYQLKQEDEVDFAQARYIFLE